MRVYQLNEVVPHAELVDLGSPENLGGKVISGEPKVAARADFSAGNLTAGVFQATTGVIEITFPFTEHATILSGRVRITDASGVSHLYTPGDSYLINEGDVVMWEVEDDFVQKSFFNVKGTQSR